MCVLVAGGYCIRVKVQIFFLKKHLVVINTSFLIFWRTASSLLVRYAVNETKLVNFVVVVIHVSFTAFPARNKDIIPKT